MVSKKRTVDKAFDKENLAQTRPTYRDVGVEVLKTRQPESLAEARKLLAGLRAYVSALESARRADASYLTELGRRDVQHCDTIAMLRSKDPRHGRMVDAVQGLQKTVGRLEGKAR